MKKSPKKRVLLAISGGVDSSVAASLLVDDYEIVGIFMKLWEEDEVSLDQNENKCCSLDSLDGARIVAAQYGFPLYTLNFRSIFKRNVVDFFLKELQSGKTPNPCLQCNKHVKFGALLEKADELGCEYVATGHYARVQLKPNGTYALLKAIDFGKDQSYLMHHFTQAQLKRVIFPLGNLFKTEVREIAAKLGLPSAYRRDSQELCFYKEKNQGAFLKRHAKLVSGNIVTGNGQTIGTHEGLALYTIGQRRGVKIGGTGPYYVIGKNKKKNELVVSNDKNDSKILAVGCVIKNTNWISGKQPKLPLSCTGSYRYHAFAPCRIIKKAGKSRYRIEFETPQRAVMPGQSFAMYGGDELLGGGIIESYHHE